MSRRRRCAEPKPGRRASPPGPLLRRTARPATGEPATIASHRRSKTVKGPLENSEKAMVPEIVLDLVKIGFGIGNFRPSLRRVFWFLAQAVPTCGLFQQTVKASAPAGPQSGIRRKPVRLQPALANLSSACDARASRDLEIAPAIDRHPVQPSAPCAPPDSGRRAMTAATRSPLPFGLRRCRATQFRTRRLQPSLFRPPGDEIGRADSLGLAA